MTQQIIDAKLLSNFAIHGLLDKKGQHIVRMNLTNVDGAVTDYFIICTGTSDRHVQSLAESVVEEMKKHGERPLNQEGIQAGEWVLLDYVNIVIHIFQRETREFYRLESLWGDADSEEIDDSFGT